MTEKQISEMDATTRYSAYGYRQEQFSYLCERSQREIIEHAHALANMMNEARDMRVVKICDDGYVITSGMVWAEIRQSRTSRATVLPPMTLTDPMYTGYHGVMHFA